MKLKFRADPHDLLVFGIFAGFLLYVVAIVVSNLASFATEGTLSGFNPFPAFEPRYILTTLMLFILALGALFISVSSYFFDREKGLGLTTEKKDKGYSRWTKDKEIKEELECVPVQAKRAKAAGIPLIVTKEELWVDNGEYHSLIIGATGSGKSVCINTLIISILYKATPDEVRLIMIDPKVVELSVYNGIPHLFIPVVTDPKKAAGALNRAVSEMTSRYNAFAEYGVRNLGEYNKKVANMRVPEGETAPEKMPQIVIIVDELADLMMVAPGEVEDAICRLAQLARAAGIHLIIATQRPSVNVITGLIKANMPSRIAFSVSSGVDSRTILDMNGAEKLLGKGDMLFYPQGYQKPARLQGAFVSDEEVSAVVEYVSDKNQGSVYDTAIEKQVNTASAAGGAGGGDRDVYFTDAGKFIIEKERASIGMLQRMFKIGFNRAARIMDQLCDAGVVGPEEGTKPRKVLMSAEEFENYLEENG